LDENFGACFKDTRTVKRLSGRRRFFGADAMQALERNQKDEGTESSAPSGRAVENRL